MPDQPVHSAVYPRFFPPPARRWAWRLMLLFFGGGVLAHVWAPLRDLALALTTPLLIVTNAAVLLAVLDDERARRLRWWGLGAWVATVALEIIGVATGRVFGAYHYGATLGGQVAGVPLLIGLNWTTLLLGGLVVAERLVPPGAAGRRWLVPILAASLLTAFDWVMEPVAVRLGYWAWEPTAARVPVQNYAAWLLIGAGLAGTLGLRVRTGLAGAYFGLQLVFFVTLRVLLPLLG